MKEDRNYSRTDASITQWQEGMAELYQHIVDCTPAGEISDNSLEFKYDAENRRYMKRERPALVCAPIEHVDMHLPASPASWALTWVSHEHARPPKLLRIRDLGML